MTRRQKDSLRALTEEERAVLTQISLPYISTELRGLEEKVHVKRQPTFQHVLEPVKIKTKQALVNPVSAVNEPGFALSNDKQTEAYHPDVGQARRNQEPTDADGVREMTFVNVKTTIFLVGEEGFDTKAALVEPAGPAAIGQIRDQVDGLFGGSPSAWKRYPLCARPALAAP